MYSLAGFNRIPVDVGVHQLQAQALRSAFLRLEDKLPALPLVAGSFADPILYGKYGDNLSLTECHNRHLHLFFEIVFY